MSRMESESKTFSWSTGKPAGVRGREPVAMSTCGAATDALAAGLLGALDDEHTTARLRGLHGAFLSGGAGADDDEVVGVGGGDVVVHGALISNTDCFKNGTFANSCSTASG